MKALTFHGKRDVGVEDVPDPQVQEPTDAVTTTAICGSDLHLYEVLGHEPMGVVEEVGSAVTELRPGDRVVTPFNISCGHCWMCEQGLQSQCETTQVRDEGMGASLFGYTKLYGSQPGGQAENLRVPQAHYTHVKVPDGAETSPHPSGAARAGTGRLRDVPEEARWRRQGAAEAVAIATGSGRPGRSGSP
jgi:threonine dehydrogenase-like Zn-dependent dehydrogenase